MCGSGESWDRFCGQGPSPILDGDHVSPRPLTWCCSGGGAGRRGLRRAVALGHQAGIAAIALSLDKQLSSAGQRDRVADAQFFLLGLLPSQGHLEAQGSKSASSAPKSLARLCQNPQSPGHPRYHDSWAPGVRSEILAFLLNGTQVTRMWSQSWEMVSSP